VKSFGFGIGDDCFWLEDAKVLQLPEGGDFEALHCQPSAIFDRSAALDLTTELPLLGRCCYVLLFFPFFVLVVLHYNCLE
jgi:hypothetical protein